MSLLHRVPAAFAPRGGEPANRETRNTKEKRNQNENATRYNRRLIYCLAIDRQRKDVFPGHMPEYHPLNKQWD